MRERVRMKGERQNEQDIHYILNSTMSVNELHQLNLISCQNFIHIIAHQ